VPRSKRQVITQVGAAVGSIPFDQLSRAWCPPANSQIVLAVRTSELHRRQGVRITSPHKMGGTWKAKWQNAAVSGLESGSSELEARSEAVAQREHECLENAREAKFAEVSAPIEPYPGFA